MLIAQLSSFPIEQVANLLRLEQDLGRWCTDHPYPCRLIAISHAFDIEEAAERVRARLRDLLAVGLLADALLPSLRALTIGDATAPHPADVVADLPARADAALADLCATALPIILDDPEQASATHWLALGEVLEALTWTRPVLADLHDFYTQLATRRIRAATYLLVVWEPPTASAQEILDSLAYATGQRVVRCDQLRPILPGPVMVDEQRACLVPVDRAHPHVAVLRSYDMPTTIDALVLHPLLNGDRDIAIAVDILPLSPGKAQRLAETQYSAASMALRTSRTVDPQTAQRALDAERTLAELTTSSLHQVQVAVLVQGSDADDLAIQVAAARDRLGMAVRVEAVAGSQAELLSLFSTTPSAQIDAAWCRSDMLAHGVGCLLGVVGFHRSPITEGWLFGVDHRQAPVFIDPFSGGRAGHMVYIGVTGFGKTFAMNLLTLRAAALANNRVIWVDAYENGARLERAIGAGATRHVLSAGRTINPLDLVFGPEDGERWLHAQVGHVIAQLALIMGTLGSEGERRVLIPRVFTRDEEGFLQRAVALLYAEVP
ncbi:MAG: hypothetical protein HGB28_06065, partial [Oscillochloris sp.]|nr:hypothetical protein [Oscillochloris sp.]